jgi:hypothetical protein
VGDHSQGPRSIAMPYNPRPGSVAYLAIEHLRNNGPTGEIALAAAIDKETHELLSNLSWAMKVGGIRREVQGDEWLYSLGDGAPKGTSAAAPAAPAIDEIPTFLPVKRGNGAAHDAIPPAGDARPIQGREAAPAPIHDRRVTGEQLHADERSAPAPTALRIALWSDGTLEMHRGAERMTLQADETRALVAYLERLGA